MLKINKDIEAQLLNDCQVGSFEKLQSLNTSASSTSTASAYSNYIYYSPEMEGPFLVTGLEGSGLVSKDRRDKYEKEMVCHCPSHKTEKDKFKYNGTDMVHSWSYYTCNQCGKEYKVENIRNGNYAIA